MAHRPPDVVVTGASGLLGANLMLDYTRQGLSPAGVYHRHPIRLPGAQTCGCDLSDSAQVRALSGRWRAGAWVVHCAAATDVDWCERNPDRAFQINAEAARNVAQASREAGCRMIYVSTDAVFDGVRGGYVEDDPPNPLSVYARSKLAGEEAVREECPGSLVVRTTIYGWNMLEKKSLAEWMLSRLEAGQEVPGFADVFFTPLLVNELGSILLEMILQGCAGVYHAAGAEACSKLAFARRIAGLFGLDQGLVRPTMLDQAGLRAARPRNATLRTDKIQAALGRKLPAVLDGLTRFRALRDEEYVNTLKSLGGGHHHA